MANREKLLPFAEVELIDRCHDLNAGIGNENIDLAESLNRFGDAGLGLRLVGDVDRNADCMFGAAKLGSHRIGAFLIEVGNDNPGAFAGEQDGDFLADAAGRAGDDCNLIFKLHVRSPSFT